MIGAIPSGDKLRQFWLHLLKKTSGLLLKDTVKGLVMDPPLSRQLNLQGPLAFVATVSVFFGAKKDCAKNGVSKRGGVRGEGRKLQAPSSFILWLLCHYSCGQKSHSLVFLYFVTSWKCLLGTVNWQNLIWTLHLWKSFEGVHFRKLWLYFVKGS